jgi:hypothetical protein
VTFIDRSLIQAFNTIATQTSAESEAHQLMANALLSEISVPMKNLAETQSKARRPVSLNEHEATQQRHVSLL